jgi:hypothetical protein
MVDLGLTCNFRVTKVHILTFGVSLLDYEGHAGRWPKPNLQLTLCTFIASGSGGGGIISDMIGQDV